MRYPLLGDYMAAWWKLKNLFIGKIDSAYRGAYLRKDINQAIAVIIAAAIMVAAYAYADYLNLQKIVWGYTAIRITFFAASVWMVSLLRKTYSIDFADYAILSWGIALIAVTFSSACAKIISL